MPRQPARHTSILLALASTAGGCSGRGGDTDSRPEDTATDSDSDTEAVAASFLPHEADQNATITFMIEGEGSAFDETSRIEFVGEVTRGTGLELTALSTVDATHINGELRLSNAAYVGTYDVVVTTGDNTVVIPRALTVVDAPPDLSDVYVSLALDITRVIDPLTGSTSDHVTAEAAFVVPLDPPCGSPGPPGGGSLEWDDVAAWEIAPPTEPDDCPIPETVGAGSIVELVGPTNTIQLEPEYDTDSRHVIYVGHDLTLADYDFGATYDLIAPGEPAGIPAFSVPRAQPTVPADFNLIAPEFAGLIISRDQDWTYEWTPAGTGESAIFGTSMEGTLTDTGLPGALVALPVDDGQHQYPVAALQALEPGNVTFQAFSYQRGDYFGLPTSSIQTCRSDSTLLITAALALE